MDSKKLEDLKKIILTRSYREGDFTLASGKKSTFYIDVKTTSLYPQGAKLIGELLVQKIIQSGIYPDAVGGLTLGADPIGTSVSLAALQQGFEWPAFIVRKESKGHGTKKYIEGIENLKPGAKVVVLEDVVTSGGSGLQAVERLQQAGFHVLAIAAVVDREQGGYEAFRNLGIPLVSVFKISEFRGQK